MREAFASQQQQLLQHSPTLEYGGKRTEKQVISSFVYVNRTFPNTYTHSPTNAWRQLHDGVAEKYHQRFPQPPPQTIAERAREQNIKRRYTLRIRIYICSYVLYTVESVCRFRMNGSATNSEANFPKLTHTQIVDVQQGNQQLCVHE